LQKGQEFKIAASLDKFILDTGFNKVNHEQMKLSLGTWPADKKQKEMGAFLLLTTENVFEAFGMALLTRTLGMKIPEVEELIKGAKKESRSKKIHSYLLQYAPVTPGQMLRLICGKTGIYTTRRNPSKRVISNDNVR